MRAGPFRAEWLKLRRRGATGAVARLWPTLILLVYGVLYLAQASDQPAHSTPRQHAAAFGPLSPAHLLAVLLPYPISLLGGVLLVLLGALASGSEYDWHTLKTLLTQGPDRRSILMAKLLALGAGIVVFAVEGVLAAWMGSAAVALREHLPLAGPAPGDLLRGVGALLLMGALWAALGLWLGVLFRGAAQAIAAGLLYMLLIENLIAGRAHQSGVLRAIATALPGVNAAALGGSFGTLFGGHNTFVAIGAGQATLVVAVFVAAFVALALASLRRQDVT